ncbi:MAG: hypothetical protein P8Y28_03615 [Gammaproteobacteria bacterium]|jgi:predicted membrane protein
MKNMVKHYFSVMAVFVASMLYTEYGEAADSYRYLHVSIDTPWLIFIFLLVIILFPFVLSAILYWYFTFKKHKEEKAKQPETQISTEESQ